MFLVVGVLGANKTLSGLTIYLYINICHFYSLFEFSSSVRLLAPSLC